MSASLQKQEKQQKKNQVHHNLTQKAHAWAFRFLISWVDCDYYSKVLSSLRADGFSFGFLMGYCPPSLF